MRLHNLVWGVFNPPWLAEALAWNRGDAALERHIATVMGHTRGQALVWDVVNEPCDPRWNEADDLVRIPWKRALGAAYFDRAFHLARDADPHALLFVNDDLLEYADPASAAKRAAYLRLLERALARGVPIQGFGLQSHLRPERPFDPSPYRRFLAALASMGLVIHITEMDVIDRTLPAEPAVRGAAVAALTRAVLETALDARAVRAVLTWGLTSRYSWLETSDEVRRPDGLPTLGLPYDAALRPTPMRAAIAAALAAAPGR